MRMLRTLWPGVMYVLLVLAVPVCLVAADLALLTGHWFVRWEYGKASFPPDDYGLSTAERTRLAEVCVDYLATNADISLLADLRLPDGEPAFNERELRHMVDVQAVYSHIVTAGLVAGLVLAWGVVTLAAAEQTRRRAPKALLSGSLLTLGLLVAVGLYMLTSWDQFFTTFHRVFFAGDSWTFPYSDTLIRLFPMPFWVDVAVVIVAGLVVGMLVVGAIGWIWRRRLKSSLRVHEDVA